MEELEVLRAVLAKFGSYTGKDLADYMHKEIAYVQTADNAYIPYNRVLKSSVHPDISVTPVVNENNMQLGVTAGIKY